MSTINSLSHFNTMSAAIRRNQEKMALFEKQLATGTKGDRFSDLGTAASRSVDLREAAVRFDRSLTDIATIATRTDVADKSLGRIQAAAIEFRDLTSQLVNNADLVPTLNVQDQARSALKELERLLNSDVDGHYVFSGANAATRSMVPSETVGATVQAALTAAPPITAADAFAVVDAEFADATIFYSGGTPLQPVPIGRNETISYGITGDEGAFRDILATLHAIAETDYSGLIGGGGPEAVAQQTREFFKTAMERLTSGADRVSQLMVRNGRAQNDLDQLQADHQPAKEMFEASASELEAADPYEVATRMEYTRTMLEATFRASAAIRDLSLANFM